MTTDPDSQSVITKARPPRPGAEGKISRFQKTAELSTTELYQRRKRNILLFGSVSTLITLTRPERDIPVPLLNGEVTLPVELAFLACLLTTAYFAWEFHADWETARRKNAEIAEADSGGAESLGSALEKLISKTSYQFGITALQMEGAVRAIESLERPDKADTATSIAISSSAASLSRLSKELPQWRRSSDLLRSSYTQLHESVSRLQKTNFYIDLVIVTAIICASIGASGYIILNSFSLG